MSLKFEDFALPAPLLRSISALGFTSPTPVQEQAIPKALEGHDLIARAATGSGKTAAFLIPALARLDQNPHTSAVILVPTREIAIQCAAVLRDLTLLEPRFNHALVIGGTPFGPQVRALARKPRVIIATPGRLNDHLEQRTVTLSHVSIIVLDEADRMLDMGFAPQIDRVLKHVPNTRQTLLFSATLPENIQSLSRRYLKNPQSISVGPANVPVEAISQKIVHLANDEKAPRLEQEVRERQGSIIIFMRTQHRADKMARNLYRAGIEVAIIHGGLPQGKRRRNLEAFRSGEARILVATDVAARGLDIPHVAHVINFDLPQQAEDYVHRIGRTARGAGATGDALSLVAPEEAALLRPLGRYIMKAQVEGHAPASVRSLGTPGHRGGGARPQGGGGGQRQGGGRPQGRQHYGSKPRSAGQGQRSASGPRASGEGPKSESSTQSRTGRFENPRPNRRTHRTPRG